MLLSFFLSGHLRVPLRVTGLFVCWLDFLLPAFDWHLCDLIKPQMEISFLLFSPAFALANLCITSAGDALEIAQRGLPVTWTPGSLLCFPISSLSSSFCLSVPVSLLPSLGLLLLRPHILLGDDANASNCILGLVIYCRSMRIIFTRLPTRSPYDCMCVCAVCVHLCRRQQLPHYAAWKEITSISRENSQIFYLQMEMWAQSDRQQNCWKWFRANVSFKWYDKLEKTIKLQLKFNLKFVICSVFIFCSTSLRIFSSFSCSVLLLNMVYSITFFAFQIVFFSVFFIIFSIFLLSLFFRVRVRVRVHFNNLIRTDFCCSWIFMAFALYFYNVTHFCRLFTVIYIHTLLGLLLHTVIQRIKVLKPYVYYVLCLKH